MSTIFTRHIQENQVLGTLNLNIATRNPIQSQLLMKTYLSILAMKEFDPILVVPVDYLDGFCETPDRYWIHCNLRRVAVFVRRIPGVVNQRFVWKTPNQPDVVVTADITQDSMVFLEVQGQTLSYGKEKLLFIECQDNLVHPINIVFIDNFGLPQTVQLETGAWSTSCETTNTFRSISGEIEYGLEKIPYNALTVGQSAIKRELKDYYAGFVNSLSYAVMLNEIGDDYLMKTIDTTLRDESLTSDSFTKQYAISGVLSFNTKDVPALTEAYGELNIHD